MRDFRAWFERAPRPDVLSVLGLMLRQSRRACRMSVLGGFFHLASLQDPIAAKQGGADSDGVLGKAPERALPEEFVEGGWLCEHKVLLCIRLTNKQ